MKYLLSLIIALSFLAPAQGVISAERKKDEHQFEKTGYLGISIRGITNDWIINDSSYKPYGAVIVGVDSGSAAEMADLRVNDVIQQVNDTIIEDEQDLFIYLLKTKPGEVVKITVARKEGPVNVDAKLGAK